MANRAVVGIIPSQPQAEAVVDSLQRAGFSSADISALFSERAAGTVGSVLGLLAGIGTLAIEGLGAFVAGGPIMTALGAGAGGRAVGGLTQTLVAMGIPDGDAKRYELKLGEGNILVSVHVDDADEGSRARGIMKAGGANDVVTVGEESVPQ